jgi:hypothetical protein
MLKPGVSWLELQIAAEKWILESLQDIGALKKGDVNSFVH